MTDLSTNPNIDHAASLKAGRVVMKPAALTKEQLEHVSAVLSLHALRMEKALEELKTQGREKTGFAVDCDDQAIKSRDALNVVRSMLADHDRRPM